MTIELEALQSQCEAGGETTAGLYYLHADHLGKTQFATDTTGAVIWDGGITTPFGESLTLASAFTQNLMFPGQYADAETGLSHNWHRTYDPMLGRYLQSDPIGLAGGLNRYAYVGGNPVSMVDPMGLAPPRKGRRGGSTSQVPNYNAQLAAQIRQRIHENDPHNPAGIPVTGTARGRVDLESLRLQERISEHFRANLNQIEQFSTYAPGQYTTTMVCSQSAALRMGQTFVGVGSRPMSRGKGLYSPVTKRGYRKPTFKPNQSEPSYNVTQANFVFNSTQGQVNVHVNIINPTIPNF